MISIDQEKVSGNNRLNKEFYSCSWEVLKEAFVSSIRAAKRKMELT